MKHVSPLETCPPVRDYLNRIGARIHTLFTARSTVTSMGYERTVGSVRFDRNGGVHPFKLPSPTAEEAAAIKAAVEQLTFPEQQSLSALPNSAMPEMMLNAKEQDLFIFKDRRGNIRFVQVRIDLDNGDKRYVPFTYWSDGEWRHVEPEGGLPIYGIENISPGDRVFLHEGAKAAKAAQRIAESEDHPWAEYFRTGIHVGWIGGTHHVHRTMWEEIRNLPSEVVIVPDNDFTGKMKVSQIAEQFECECFAVQFSNEWERGWDVADPLPDWMFQESEAGPLYVGPEFDELLMPCTRATHQVGVLENGRPIYSIREEFAAQWVRIQSIRRYAHMLQPEVLYDQEQFNTQIRPYSDVTDTAALLAKVSGNLVNNVTFMPSHPPGLVRVDGELRFNQYVDRRLRPARGVTTKPFHDFLDYLFPVAEEREVVLRWIRTIYAKPGVRLGYGLLLLSKLQGVGKSTMLDMMAELIGKRHVSFPGDAMVQSDFNGWLVNKRLVVVHEIYAGQNWKTYNRLKTLITDANVEANNKHVANYTLPNWTHFAAASNSMEALRMEHDDRRWFVPKLPETLYDDYDGLYHWVRSGGLRGLAQEFVDSGDYLKQGSLPPLTDSKLALIDQSMPNDERMVLVMIERMRDGYCMDIKDIWLWLQEEMSGRSYTSPQRISTLLRERGYHVMDPLEIGGRIRTPVFRSRSTMLKALGGRTGDAEKEAIANLVQMPRSVFKDDAPM